MDKPLIGPRKGETAGIWFLKIFTGLVVLFLLFIHLVVNHLVAEGGLLTYNDVVQYYQNPIVPVMEIAFLIFVVSHALIGLRGVLLDLNPTRAVLKGMDVLFPVVGVVSIVYGIWLIVVIVSRGAAG